MQSVSSRIWTRIVVSNSYDDNHYTTGTSTNVEDNVLKEKTKTKNKKVIFFLVQHACLSDLPHGRIWRNWFIVLGGRHAQIEIYAWPSQKMLSPFNIFQIRVPLASSQELSYIKQIFYGGARGVMVIVVGNGLGDTSSNPGRDWLHFT